MTADPSASLRVGILGCGQIANSHATVLRSLPGVDLVAVADVSLDRARSFAEVHDVPRAYADAEDLLAGDLQAVMVCTPHAAHEAGVLAAARYGIHVLCEKPMALALDEAHRMIEATRLAGVRFGVVFQRRFWPAAARIRRAIDDGRLGPPIIGGVIARFNRDAAYYAEPWRGTWAAEGGGVLMTQAIHHIDLLQWFMGSPTRVAGRSATLKHREIIQVEDTVVATVEFASGALATIQAGTTFRPGLGAQVWVSDADGRTAGVTEFPEGVGFTDLWTVPGEEEFASAYHSSLTFDPPLADVHRQLMPYHALQIEDFVDAIRSGQDPAVTGVEAAKSLAIVRAVYASSRTGQPVDLDLGP